MVDVLIKIVNDGKVEILWMTENFPRPYAQRSLLTITSPGFNEKYHGTYVIDGVEFFVGPFTFIKSGERIELKSPIILTVTKDKYEKLF